jgi:hypothetical protein
MLVVGGMALLPLYTQVGILSGGVLCSPVITGQSALSLYLTNVPTQWSDGAHLPRRQSMWPGYCVGAVIAATCPVCCLAPFWRRARTL